MNFTFTSLPQFKNTFNRLKWIAGFTLVELLVYMGLLAGFVVIMSGVFVALLDSKTQIIDSSTLNQDSQYVLQRLEYDIARSQAITTPGTNGTTTATLVLSVPEGTLTYAVTNQQLTISDGTTTSVLTHPSTKTTALSFERLGNTDGMSTITIAITLQSLSTTETTTLTHTVGTR